MALLSRDERERRGRLIHDRDRRDFLAAHALLRQALSLYEEQPPASWQFETSALGKPKLSIAHSDRQLAFNLSHTRGLVACAIARSGDVGVDVEAINRDMDVMDIANQNFSPVEIDQLGQCATSDISTRFIELWTLKESFVKATGKGITAGLDQWGFRFGDADKMAFEGHDVAGGAWSFALFAPTAQTRLAVASNTQWPRITVRAFDLRRTQTIENPLVAIRTSDVL